MSEIPTVELIVRWLVACLDQSDPVVVFSHHMDTHVPSWVKRNYGRRHNAATYDRKWRRLRSDKQHFLQRAGIVVREIPSSLNPKENEKAWQIAREARAASTQPSTNRPLTKTLNSSQIQSVIASRAMDGAAPSIGETIAGQKSSSIASAIAGVDTSTSERSRS